MRDKKMFISAILMSAVMIFAGGCGKQAEPVSAELAETVKEVDTEERLAQNSFPAALTAESMESLEATDNSQNESVVEDETIAKGEVIMEDETIAKDEAIVEDEAIAEDEVVVENEVIVEDDDVVEDKFVVEDKVAVEGTTSTKTELTKTESTKTEFAETEPAKAESAETAPTETTPAQTGSVHLEQPHEHNWIAHTDQRWVSQIVTVVDEPERYEEYTIFKIYWYNTGTWEETRDPDRFREWAYSENGSLYPFYHIEKMEDNPLFLGYNELGQPSFIGDHVLWGGCDFVPAVTHEEDQGYYETYVDYYYCDCGAAK